MNNEIAYWMALAHAENIGNKKKNNIINKIYSDSKLSLEKFWSLTEDEWQESFNLTEKNSERLNTYKSKIQNFSFLAERLYNEGYEIIPIVSEDYSNILKQNLKENAPLILYVKGNKKLLQKKSVAIVGSRNASQISLNFTDNIAKLKTLENKVIVSGFAKGVDRQALNSAIRYSGESIIVLPQGILTFSTGYKNYYKQIINGQVLVLSTFYPDAKWDVKLAMARNEIIYGLAEEIFVAESNEKGGTWEGAISALKKGVKVYIRKPDDNEKNSNNLLIGEGAIPVDFNGNVLLPIELQSESIFDNTQDNDDSSSTKNTINNYNLMEKKNEIETLLKEGVYSLEDIIIKLNLPVTNQKLSKFLGQHLQANKIKREGKNYYTLKQEEKNFEEQIELEFSR